MFTGLSLLFASPEAEDIMLFSQRPIVDSAVQLAC